MVLMTTTSLDAMISFIKFWMLLGLNERIAIQPSTYLDRFCSVPTLQNQYNNFNSTCERSAGFHNPIGYFRRKVDICI